MTRAPSTETAKEVLLALREAEYYYASAKDPNLRQQSDLCKRAASEIERLRAELAAKDEEWESRMADCCDSARDYYERHSGE